MDREPMTVEGAQALREELQRLKANRSILSEAIAKARAHGDLRENAEYHSARDQQGLEEAHIRKMESKLSRAQIIDVSELPHTGRVVFGTSLLLRNLGDDTEVHVRIVGTHESDSSKGYISVKAPLARALIGKQAGDVAEVELEAGTSEYEILKVEYC